MKIELQTYMHKQNGVTLYLLPDNEIERELLKGFAKHGELVMQDGKLQIRWDFREPAQDVPRT